MKKLLRQLPKAMLLLLVMLVFVQANAQKRLAPLAVSDFRYTLGNDVQVDSKTLEFDIFLMDTDPLTPNFEASIIQSGILITKACLAGGTPVLTLVAGTSEMSSAEVPNSFAYASVSTTLGQLKISGRSAPGCGSGTMLSTTAPGTRFGRFRVTNSVPFATNSQANLTFNFNGTVPYYKTSLYQYTIYSPCTSTLLATSASNCYNLNYTNVVLNPPAAPTAYAVTGGGAYCEGSTQPFPAVGLANSQVGVTYTLYQNGLPLTPTYTGTGTAIPMGNRPGTFVYSVIGVGNGVAFGGSTAMLNTVTVTMNPRPVITFNTMADLCVGGPLYTLTATPTGGAYSGSTFLVAPNQFNPSTIGTYGITYNYSDGLGCAALPVTQGLVVKSCTPTWSGAVSTVWGNPGNWLGNNVPAADGEAIIPAGCVRYPVITEVGLAAIHIGTLTINGTGAKSVLSGGMVVSGELVVGGNLTISSTGSLDVSADGALTIDGNLNIVGSLLIESQGSMITNGDVNGTATVQRNIPTNKSWHFLSSPVAGQSIVNGNFAPALSFFPGDINTWDFYRWQSGYCTDQKHWINLRLDNGFPNASEFPGLGFEESRGYLVAYTTPFPVTHSFIGAPNTGDRNAYFYDVQDVCSWSLPGNPYPSAIQWSSILALTENANTFQTPYYYIWNDVTANYEWWGDNTHFGGTKVDGNVPAEQGFFIKVKPTSLGGSLHLKFPNLGRIHDNATDTWIKSEVTNKLTVKIENGTQYSDFANIMFENNVAVGHDYMDAEKMFSMNTSVPQIYTIIDNNFKSCSNSLPYFTDGMTVPVGFIAPAEGSYTISVNGVSNFSSLTGLVLEDLTLNVSQNLLTNPTYTFTSTGKEDAGRFLLHFAGTIGIDSKDNSPINIFSNEKTVSITCAAGFKNATVTISNLLGQQILTRKLSDQKLNQVEVNALKGYYIVKVQDASSVKTAKVYIN
jgi:hypothetical protein